ncbi:hypothetical protein [Chitinophaga sancti]|uniref:Repeat domain-containing protein n=2 Tax=Chitinophaga sancti TaxID=1004 RepID=A0A1K1RKY0_9BACT|nr:hypothetical protein [Chitinophaga sancti]WQD60775.1 hypothetical protein U0033_23025 [Chitinophaga sancti]WQG87097.1 hypothetical protein SR876_19445 [Chitinophaga sancti]SFW72451.1 hypothetical protein SAMN05661012_03936 [Chitinophaga sancti]
MKLPVFILLLSMLHCGQHPKTTTTTEDTTQTINDTTKEENTEAGYAEIGQYEIDSLFTKNKDSLSYNFEDILASVKIGYLFSKENKDAIFRYYPDDTTVHIIVLRQFGAKWDTIFSEMISPVRMGAYSDFITVQDFNGDHIPDLKVIKDFWDIHVGENSDLWLYRNRHFIKVKNFDHIVSAEYLVQTGLIYSYQSAGCADMAMQFGTYRIVADTVQQLDFRYCGCCDTSDSCEIKVKGKESFKVPYKRAYKYVPELYQEAVKDKLEM